MNVPSAVPVETESMRPASFVLLGLMACATADPVASAGTRGHGSVEDAGADASAADASAASADASNNDPHLMTLRSKCPTAYVWRPPVSLVSTVKGAVTASLPDGADGWYLAGFFTEVGGVPVQGLAHVLATGELDDKLRHGVDVSPWMSWTTNVNGMVRIGMTLYVAGGFLSVAGAERRYFAAFNLVTGELLPWNPLPFPIGDEERQHRTYCDFSNNYDFGCRSLATDGQTIFGAALCGVVALDPMSGARAEGFTVPRFDGVEDPTISTVAILGDALCADGYFSDVAVGAGPAPTHVARNGAAWFDPHTGQLLP